MLIYNRLGTLHSMSRQKGIDETARKLHSAALHLMRYVRTQDTILGVPPAQLSALSVVVFGGKQSLSELAKAEQVRPPTMSRIVDGLVEDGLVKRDVDKTDRRSVVITATDKGVKIMHEGRNRREQQLIQLLNSLPRQEVELLDKASEIIAE
ncbi:MAG TPA: MarR family transcriptional regulator, partial [Candidatus Bathyarchaeia archaeon]|nr:MarR family transcriptional regulator [Candidatus Bathyarchaeia archaeon]